MRWSYRRTDPVTAATCSPNFVAKTDAEMKSFIDDNKKLKHAMK